jgi:hypothetical protein
VLNETEPAVFEALIAEKLLLEFKVRVAAPSAAPCTEVPSTAKVDEGPPEKLTGVPTVVVDQEVNGVIVTDDELVLEELLPPAHAIKVIGKTKMARFFKVTPSYQLWQMKLFF